MPWLIFILLGGAFLARRFVTEFAGSPISREDERRMNQKTLERYQRIVARALMEKNAPGEVKRFVVVREKLHSGTLGMIEGFGSLGEALYTIGPDEHDPKFAYHVFDTSIPMSLDPPTYPVISIKKHA